MSLTNYELWSFRDAVEHVVDVFTGQDSSPRTWRNARRAVREAYRDLPTKRTWRYFERTEKITTVVSQSTGTIVYRHAGGMYERMVTLTGATWPADVRYYGLLVGRNRYAIDDYKSSTVLTLTESSNPGSDLVSTGYTLYRDTYPLPADFWQMGRLTDVSSGVRVLMLVTMDALLVANRGVLTTSLPHLCAVSASPHYPGGLALVFGPSPTTARTYDAIYSSKGRPIALERECTGTVAVSAGATAVVGTSTNFTSAMEGALIRFSTDNVQLPTGPVGSIEASEVDNDYAEQAVIKSVTDGTNLTLETAVVSAYSGVKFTISDRLDLESTMLNYFLRLCEAKFARIEGRNDRSERDSAAEKELREAAGADNRTFSQNEPYHGPWRLRDLATSVNG